MKKIMVVDDEMNIAKILEVRLAAAGYMVVIAYDGEDAWNKIKLEKPDLVILDIGVPKMDGFAICELIKLDAETKNIPVFILTARESVGDMEKAFKLGAAEYIKKPYDWERVLAKIKKVTG